MVSGQAGYKARMLAALMAVFALWATAASAGVSEDFLKAASSGDLSAIKRFIANGVNVNTKATSNGATALIHASWQGHKEVVELLLAKGADVNAKMTNGATALIDASLNGHKEVVELLLAKGADINAKTGVSGISVNSGNTTAAPMKDNALWARFLKSAQGRYCFYHDERPGLPVVIDGKLFRRDATNNSALIVSIDDEGVHLRLKGQIQWGAWGSTMDYEDKAKGTFDEKTILATWSKFAKTFANVAIGDKTLDLDVLDFVIKDTVRFYIQECRD